MALSLLRLSLTLLWALKTQAQKSADELASPSLRNVPVLPNFQDDKFQGEWNAIGWAQNTLVNESTNYIKMLRATFYLNDDHSYNVTSVWFSDQECTTQQHTLVPRNLPGEYIMRDVNGIKGLQNFTMRVVENRHNEFVIVFYQATFESKEYVKCILYDRNKQLIPNRMIYFLVTAISMGFEYKDIYFSIPGDGCKIDYVG